MNKNQKAQPEPAPTQQPAAARPEVLARYQESLTAFAALYERLANPPPA